MLSPNSMDTGPRPNLEKLAAQHHEQGTRPDSRCAFCDDAWPCDMRICLDYICALEQALA